VSVAAGTLPYPHIARDPAISGGQAVVAGTRVPVGTLVRAHQCGMEFDEILVQYPGLSPAQLHAAFLYYLDHKDEVEAVLREAESAPPGAEVLRR
jgi:uncharacterized protein (DUF433 family)